MGEPLMYANCPGCSESTLGAAGCPIHRPQLVSADQRAGAGDRLAAIPRRLVEMNKSAAEYIVELEDERDRLRAALEQARDRLDELANGAWSGRDTREINLKQRVYLTETLDRVERALAGGAE